MESFVDFNNFPNIKGKTEEKVIKLRSTYYALERNGQVYHVFDASKMVKILKAPKKFRNFQYKIALRTYVC